MITPLIFQTHAFRPGEVGETCNVRGDLERPIRRVGRSYCAVATVVVSLSCVDIVRLSNVGKQTVAQRDQNIDVTGVVIREGSIATQNG